MSLHINDLPPEVLAETFLIGVRLWGLGYLPPVSLTCSIWNHTVVHTPALWGHFALYGTMPWRLRQRIPEQLQRVKSAPLTVYVSSKAGCGEYQLPLASLCSQWVDADVTTDMLLLCNWQNMASSLQRLSLSSASFLESAADFFGETPAKPLKLHRLVLDRPLMDTLLYIHKTPNLNGLVLANIQPGKRRADLSGYQPLRLHELQILELSQVPHYDAVLTYLQLPNLRGLTISQPNVGVKLPHGEAWSFLHESKQFLPRFLDHWFSSPKEYIPTQLHTLELTECILTQEGLDVVIKLLHQLPELVYLSITTDDPPLTPILEALSHPNVCPALLRVEMAGDLDVGSVKKFAKERETFKRLRLISGFLCSVEEMEDLRQFVDEAYCICIGCSMLV
ncbi:hypothetical protein DL96DRAFT_1813019 [Flagelloscypha sp. PMI_526]|nr:hypothetical protein DL96DRAFT_1813019 [Flagelloscypha sp. PMI_526]